MLRRDPSRGWTRRVPGAPLAGAAALVAAAVGVLLLAADVQRTRRGPDQVFRQPALADELAIVGIVLLVSTGLLATLRHQGAVDRRTMGAVVALATVWSVVSGNPFPLGVAGFVLLVRAAAPLDRATATLGTLWASSLCAGTALAFPGDQGPVVDAVALGFRGLSYVAASVLAMHVQGEVARGRGPMSPQVDGTPG